MALIHTSTAGGTRGEMTSTHLSRLAVDGVEEVPGGFAFFGAFFFFDLRPAVG
jgi:hypothetical protein